MEDRGGFCAVGHNDFVWSVIMQFDHQSSVAVRADSKDVKMSIVIGNREESGACISTEDGSSRCREATGTTD